MEAIDVLLEEPEHMERLWENTAYFKSMLVKMGLTLTQSETPILPILIGDEGVAKQFSDQLLSHGVLPKASFSYSSKGKSSNSHDYYCRAH